MFEKHSASCVAQFLRDFTWRRVSQRSAAVGCANRIRVKDSANWDVQIKRINLAENVDETEGK